MKLFYSVLLSIFIFPLYVSAAINYVSVSNGSSLEGNSTTNNHVDFNITFSRVIGNNKSVTFDYYMTDGWAEGDVDYNATTTSATLVGSGDTITIQIPIYGDNTAEGNETFNLHVTNFVANINDDFVVVNNGIGTIINDDFPEVAPIIYHIENQYIVKDAPFSLDLSAYVVEVNNDVVTYSISSTPDITSFGLSFDSSTGILSGTPTSIAEYTLVLTATDNDGSTSSDPFIINVDYGFCYEYSYSQNGVFFTENNDGTQSPKIVSGIRYIETTSPIDVTLYLRYRADLNVSDLNISIVDIDTTQVRYDLNSTYIAKNGIQKVLFNDALDTNESQIKDIEIGDVSYNDYLYVDYQLNPQHSLIDTPIVAKLDFRLDGTEQNLIMGEERLPLCSATTGSGYTPVDSIFSVVHSNFYDYENGGTARNYNLPTQVVKRVGNFKVVAFDPDDIDEPQEVKAVPVSIELIDVGIYGNDIEAACQQPKSAITPKVWVVFTEDSSSMSFNEAAINYAISVGLVSTGPNGEVLTTASDFYNTATKNVAFRTSYNHSGNDDDVVTLSVADGPSYNVDNFSDAVKAGNCAVDVDGNPDNTDTIAQFCDNSGAASSMTPNQLRLCMECVYGLSTKLTCSRDNFSIRPEAFMIKIDDQNQSDTTSQLRLADDLSGVSSASTPTTTNLNLVSGYLYNVEVNATTYVDSSASDGYIPTITANYIFEPRTITPTSCFDESNQSAGINFIDGYVNTDIAINQVGEYRLNILDDTWTSVDSVNYKTGTYFTGSPDCASGSSVEPVGSSTLNGCDISSNHVNTNANLTYRDYDITFHPYKFDLTGINPYVGLNNTPATTSEFIYMSDMSQDEAMSFHLNGDIRASGYNGSNATNFTTGCYAKPIDINILKSNIVTQIAYQYKFNTLNETNTTISFISGDLNNTTVPMQLSDGNFTISSVPRGSINSNLNLNFFRESNNTANPERVLFSAYNVDCQDPNVNCSFNADLSTKTTKGVKILDNNITHLYGRTHASRQRYEGPTGTANMYYEAYCFNTLNGNTCDKTLLPNALSSKRTDDIRWFINEEHNVSNHGNVGTVTEKDAANVTASTPIPNNPSTTNLTYNETQGYPYKTTMHNNASGWLIYNKDDPTATRNEFSVEFEQVGAGWSGEHETNTTTKDVGSAKTNRRSMW